MSINIFTDTVEQNVFENCNLPAQTMLQTSQEYPAIILNIDGIAFWVTTEDPAQFHEYVFPSIHIKVINKIQ